MNRGELAKLTRLLCKIFEKTTGYSEGHIHFMFRGKKDHLVLVLHNGELVQIVAKNKDCKKGESVEWSKSEFSDSSPLEAFLKFSAQIERVMIDEPNFQKSWNCLSDFLNWLNKMSKKQNLLGIKGTIRRKKRWIHYKP